MLRKQHQDTMTRLVLHEVNANPGQRARAYEHKCDKYLYYHFQRLVYGGYLKADKRTATSPKRYTITEKGKTRLAELTGETNAA